MIKRTCKQCGKDFTLTDSEVNFYKSKDLDIPKRCSECRKKNKDNNNNVNKDNINNFDISNKQENNVREWRWNKYALNKRPGFPYLSNLQNVLTVC